MARAKEDLDNISADALLWNDPAQDALCITMADDQCSADVDSVAPASAAAAAGAGAGAESAMPAAASACAAQAQTSIELALSEIFNSTKSTAGKPFQELEQLNTLRFVAELLNVKRMAELTTYLAVSKTVKLDLTMSGMTDELCIELAKSLATNLYLEKLILDYNFLSDKGLKAIFDAIQSNKHNTNLTHLSIQKCFDSEEVAINLIYDFLQKNHTVCTLNFSSDSNSSDSGFGMDENELILDTENLKRHTELQRKKAEIQQRLSQNKTKREKAIKEGIPWMSVVTRLSFIRALRPTQVAKISKKHHLENSIEPLLPLILSLAGNNITFKQGKPSLAVKTSIVDTKFAKAQIAEPTPTSETTVAVGGKRKAPSSN